MVKTTCLNFYFVYWDIVNTSCKNLCHSFENQGTGSWSANVLKEIECNSCRAWSDRDVLAHILFEICLQLSHLETIENTAKRSYVCRSGPRCTFSMPFNHQRSRQNEDSGRQVFASLHCVTELALMVWFQFQSWYWYSEYINQAN